MPLIAAEPGIDLGERRIERLGREERIRVFRADVQVSVVDPERVAGEPGEAFDVVVAGERGPARGIQTLGVEHEHLAAFQRLEVDRETVDEEMVAGGHPAVEHGLALGIGLRPRVDREITVDALAGVVAGQQEVPPAEPYDRAGAVEVAGMEQRGDQGAPRPHDRDRFGFEDAVVGRGDDLRVRRAERGEEFHGPAAVRVGRLAVDVVDAEQRGLHAAGGNLERLEEESAHAERHAERHGQHVQHGRDPGAERGPAGIRGVIILHDETQVFGAFLLVRVGDRFVGGFREAGEAFLLLVGEDVVVLGEGVADGRDDVAVDFSVRPGEGDPAEEVHARLTVRCSSGRR